MSTSSTIGHAEIAAITQEIWTTMVAMPVTPVPERLVPDKHNGYVVASVQIIGEYEGAVRIDMDYSLAALAAATLLGIDVAELSQEDLRDAAGELANMTGGSVKALIEGDCRLSLPSVVIGRDYEFTIPNGVVTLQSSFVTDAGRLLVSLIRKNGEA